MLFGKEFPSPNRPLTLLFLVAAVLSIYGYLQPDPPATGDQFYLDNAGGAVLFTHAAHQQHDTKCVSCHHALIQTDAVDCSDCHDEPEYTIDDYSHEEIVEVEDHSCLDCHDLLPDSEARSCRHCHPAFTTGSEPEIDAANCQQCHDDPDYVVEDFTHQELQELEDHSCTGCHQPGPIGEIYHLECTACHRGEEPERFINDQGEAICKSCHLI